MEANDKDLIIAKYKKRSRIMSVITGVMVFLTFIFFLYAFVQQGFAEEQKKLAIESAENAKRNAVAASELRMKLEQCADEAQRAQQQAEAALQKALKK